MKRVPVYKINNKDMGASGFPEPNPNMVRVEGGKLITIEELCKSIDAGCRRFWNRRDVATNSRRLT